MPYHYLPPPEPLKNYIRFFWILENKDSSADLKTFTIMADGCPGLIFQKTESQPFYQNGKVLPTTFLYGQATTHAQIALSRSTTIGIYFYPHVFPEIFGFNAHELTNTCLNVDELASSRHFYLTEQLMQATSATEQIKLLSAYLLSQINCHHRLGNGLINEAVAQIVKTKGNIAVKDLQKNLRLTERSLERKFKQNVGISPKMFSRICRFQAALSQVKNYTGNKLSDIAYENEYADQSHFIREFKEFAGFTPYQFQKQPSSDFISLPELIR
ncbi:helix-turn-helix domain-containing protein [Adhaeribacter pallidiroseus]|uniref:HTH araC/xylS-type domain-containing protein n=1 Tax=Adhaeribacter pallidiroseus TaxID=2072847 RepID=A0A369QJ40_9BACT|nr:helix-turn-helix domain-containing protein [Adhaeribacter pallidiroseus]RDC64320.1 hypothetical protein AHMF7616_02933 [Adhaeribacter pallidiroseus]